MEMHALASTGRGDVLSATCPSRQVLELVANKWALLVLTALRDQALRNGELLRQVEGISQKVLTQTLRELQRNGFVQREDAHTRPPRVDYCLTPLGRSLSDALDPLDDWVRTHFGAVQAQQRAHRARLG